MPSTTSSAKQTFRDPAGTVYRDGGRILREVYADSAPSALAWLGSERAHEWERSRRMTATTVVIGKLGEAALLEHEPVFFPSYPWEWTPGQWMEAARLTLELCDEALEDGYILKDATPLNILFSGARPILVDVLSVERREPCNPLWAAYAQFVRTFLLPLSAYVHLGWPLAAVQQHRDGYEPDDLAPFLSVWQRIRAPFLMLVTIPRLLEKRIHGIGYRAAASEESSTFTLHRLLKKTQRQLDILVRPVRHSRWSRYTATMTHYSNEDKRAKLEAVRSWLEELHPKRVLDVGANTGDYSRLAASCGAQVVAWDTDQEAVEENWQQAYRDGLPILALVANFAWPTPSTGWRNEEHLSLLERARGQFDCVLMLGLLHHLLVNERLPLAAILQQVAEITRHAAIVEWIPREDGQFKDLCRGRDALYYHLTEERFLEAVTADFAVHDQQHLPNGRSLWLLEKRT